MNLIVVILLIALLGLVLFIASKLIRRVTNRSSELGVLGFAILLIGFVVTAIVLVYFFHLKSPELPLVLGTVGGSWALVAQFFAGQKVEPPK